MLKQAIEKLTENISKTIEVKPCLERAPLTEWEVVYLLGRIAESADFTMIEDSDSFPDCTLGVSIEGNLVPIKVEMEYKSSNFDHDSNKCDLVICWKKDCFLPVPIIELEPLFKTLPVTQDKALISLSDKSPELLNIFNELQDLFIENGLADSNTGVKSETQTHTFKFGNQSVCSLQFSGKGADEYVRFRIYRDFVNNGSLKLKEELDCKYSETATAINFDLYREHLDGLPKAKPSIDTIVKNIILGAQ